MAWKKIQETDKEAMELAAGIHQLNEEIATFAKTAQDKLNNLNQIRQSQMIALIEMVEQDRGKAWGLDAIKDADGKIKYYFIFDAVGPQAQPQQMQQPSQAQQRGGK